MPLGNFNIIKWSAGGEENMIKFERCPRLAEDGECRSSRPGAY